jgi:hypothetical protein
MKSQTLTNVLLLVIAVGTVGNLFERQAARSPAAAQSPTRQSRFGDGAVGVTGRFLEVILDLNRKDRSVS